MSRVFAKIFGKKLPLHVTNMNFNRNDKLSWTKLEDVPKLSISSRINSIAESATLKVDAKAKTLIAEGKHVISFAAGEPDFPTADHIVEAAVKAARDPKYHRYSATAGLIPLREAIVKKTSRDSGLDVGIDQVVVTNGGKQAVYEAFQAVLDPGDEVIMPTPYWTTYPEVIKLTGAVPVEVFAGADQNYLVTVEQLEAAKTEKTKVLLFVSPSNPTGSVYSEEQTRAIGQWALENDLWVLTDEIYQNITYDGVRALSIAEAVPELADRTVIMNGVAKTYAMTGWRLGWMVAPTPVVKAVTTLQSHLTSNINNIAQMAAVEALEGTQEPVHQMQAAFARRRELIISELRKIPGFQVPTPQGAFYAYPDVSGLLNRDYDGKRIETSLELADYILDKAEVALVPGEAFGPSGYLRLSYALGDDDILEGIQRLQKLFGA